MEQLCALEGASCEIFSYETVTTLVAANLTFRGARARHFYTIYYDLDWASFSPGQVLVYEASLEALEQNLDCDFMTGEYPYKTRLANTSVMLKQVSVSNEDWRRLLAEHTASKAA